MSFEYPSDAVEAVTQDNFRHHFKGSEMVVAGKLQAQGPDVLTAKVSGQTVSMIEHPGAKGQPPHSQPEALGSSPSHTKFQLIGPE